MDMDMYEVCGNFVRNYVEELNLAKRENDWDSQTYVRREADRLIRELRRVVRAVDLLDHYSVGMVVK